MLTLCRYVLSAGRFWCDRDLRHNMKDSERPICVSNCCKSTATSQFQLPRTLWYIDILLYFDVFDLHIAFDATPVACEPFWLGLAMALE